MRSIQIKLSLDDAAKPRTLWAGLWEQNPATIHLLGLCPLLAVTTTGYAGIVLGVASALTVILSSLLTSLLRAQLNDITRLPACIVIIATLVSGIDMLIEAYAYEVHRTLGLFIPLIVTNCAIAARAEGFAAKHSPLPALVDGTACGVGIALTLTLMGLVREFVHTGSVGSLLGSAGEHSLFLLAILPTGAFFTLALLIVVQRALMNKP